MITVFSQICFLPKLDLSSGSGSITDSKQTVSMIRLDRIYITHCQKIYRLLLRSLLLRRGLLERDLDRDSDLHRESIVSIVIQSNYSSVLNNSIITKSDCSLSQWQL